MVNQLSAATAPGVENGVYYISVGKTEKGSKYARDWGPGKKPWDRTERELVFLRV